MAREMAGQSPFVEYLEHFDGLIGDRRTVYLVAGLCGRAPTAYFTTSGR